MNSLSRRLFMLTTMLSSCALGILMQPTHLLADNLPKIDLDIIVPSSVGEWSEDKTITSQIVNPQQKAQLEQLYSQTIERTYRNKAGYRIMLSIAYGRNQSGDLQVHIPDVCYPAQGFQVKSRARSILTLPDRAVPVIELETESGQRLEPVTYWMTVGDQVPETLLKRRIAEVRYAISGYIPDGMLIRFSSIDSNSDVAHDIQLSFAGELMGALPKDLLDRFAGAGKLKLN
jgi:EpsI family protein